MDNDLKRRRDDDSGDYPPHSRLFVVCDKSTTREEFMDAFGEYGNVEDIRIPKNRDTGEPRGVAYIKFSKTSEAATAIENLNRQPIGNSQRPLKVLVAANRSDIQGNDDDRNRYTRLFITIPPNTTEEMIRDEFSKYGEVVDVTFQWDKNAGRQKDLGFVKFSSFYDAAIAFEQCERKYRAIFAQPKPSKRPETAFESNINNLAMAPGRNMNHGLFPFMKVQPKGFVTVNYMCSPYLIKEQVQDLFNIIPGMVNFDHFLDLYNNFGKGSVEYSNPTSAAYAVEKLNRFEYPPGVKIFVRPDKSQFNEFERNFNNLPNVVNKLNRAITSNRNTSAPDLAALTEAIAEASKLIKKATVGVTDNIADDDLNYCSVKLPPTQPLADIDSPVAKRCFLVCKPQPPPLTVLRDIFCRFGDLINVYTLPNKTVGYARYSSETAADEAIKVLHGAEICGVRIKVLEAEEEDNPKRARRA